MEAIFSQDPMTFGQSWTADAGEGFSAATSLDIDFSSFDPALIEALPASIPDFFLVPPPPQHQDQEHPTSTNISAATATTTSAIDAQHQQLRQQFESHMLQAHAPVHTASSPGLIPSSVGTQSISLASSPSDAASPRAESSIASHARASGSRSGAGRQSARREQEQQQQADEDADVVLKRQRNTIAARKYRQKRLDRIKELEDALESMTQERDDLRLRLARQEAETAALKDMMRMRSGQGSDSAP